MSPFGQLDGGTRGFQIEQDFTSRHCRFQREPSAPCGVDVDRHILARMRILFVNDYGAMCGGAERTIIGLRDEMRRRGHRAALFTSSVRPAGAASFADFECRGTAGSLRTLLQSANPWARLRLGHVLRQFRPDVVHVGLFLTQLSPLILPLLRTVPSIYRSAQSNSQTDRLVESRGAEHASFMGACRSTTGCR